MMTSGDYQILNQSSSPLSLETEAGQERRFKNLLMSSSLQAQKFRFENQVLLDRARRLFFDRNGRIITEAVPFKCPRLTYLQQLKKQLSFHSQRCAIDLGTPTFVAISPRMWFHNYFHFHIDALAPILAFKRWAGDSNEIILLLESAPVTFMTQALEYFKIPWVTLADVIPETVQAVLIKNVIFMNSHRKLPAQLGPRDRLDPRVLQIFAESTADSSPQTNGPKRIVIDRKDASSRRLSIGDEAQDLLDQSGFESVVLSELSYQEQVSLFSAVSHVVAPHGAGLTNLLFSSAPNVLEVHCPEHGVKPDYFQISQAVGGRYWGYVSPVSYETPSSLALDKDLLAAWLGDVTMVNRLLGPDSPVLG